VFGSGIPDPGWVKIRIRDPGYGINIQDPQHWNKPTLFFCCRTLVLNNNAGKRAWSAKTKDAKSAPRRLVGPVATACILHIKTSVSRGKIPAPVSIISLVSGPGSALIRIQNCESGTLATRSKNTY